jgi:outer membrane protein OmpA-like peptidoglycan-associated protein
MKSLIAMLVLVTPLLALAQVSQSVKAPVANASVDELIDALKPRAVTRGLGRNLMVEPSKIDLSVNFEFNSATLRPESIPLLERLATAMKTEQLMQSGFQVEGHTDAIGSTQYNDALSVRRAQAVVEFLIRNKIDPSRLQPTGKGSSELLLPDDPTAGANRRVRISSVEMR